MFIWHCILWYLMLSIKSNANCLKLKQFIICFIIKCLWFMTDEIYTTSYCTWTKYYFNYIVNRFKNNRLGISKYTQKANCCILESDFSFCRSLKIFLELFPGISFWIWFIPTCVTMFSTFHHLRLFLSVLRR